MKCHTGIRISAFSFVISLICTNVFSAPSIAGAIGNLVNGGTITINGSSFGSKAVAAPIRFDNFNSGVNGTELFSGDASWKKYNDMKGADYSSAYAHSGDLSVTSHIASGESFNTNYFTYPQPSDELFVSYWWRTANADNNDNTIIKLTRLSCSEAAGGTSIYMGIGNTTLGGTYDIASNSGPYYAYDNGATHEVVLKYFQCPPRNQWIRIDMFKKLSTAGVKDGIAECNMIGVDYAIDTAAVTRASGYSFKLNTVLLGLMDGAASTHDYDMFIDDIYIDNTRARVEIGNAPTWSACNHFEVQSATQWANGQIAFRVNLGSFTPSDVLYAYVVNSDGEVNTNGFALSGIMGIRIESQNTIMSDSNGNSVSFYNIMGQKIKESHTVKRLPVNVLFTNDKQNRKTHTH